MRSLPLVLCLLFLLCACGSGDSSASAGGSDGPPTIAMIPKGTAHEFWQTVHAGALTAAAATGSELLWVGPQPEGDRAAQIKVVENCITKGVDGIVLMPVDHKALVRVAQEAKDAGIPVLIADSDLAWQGRVSFVATDNYAGGRLAGDELRELLQGKGKVVMMRYVEGSESTDQRETGFLDSIAEAPDIEVISSNQYSGSTKEGAQSVAENLLLAHPEIDGIFCPAEGAAHGMMRALEESGRHESLAFVGFDSSESLMAGLESGVIDALVLQNPFAMGQLSVETLMQHLSGRNADGRVDTGVMVVTTENLQSPEVQAVLTPDLSILQR